MEKRAPSLLFILVYLSVGTIMMGYAGALLILTSILVIQLMGIMVIGGAVYLWYLFVRIQLSIRRTPNYMR